MFSSWFKDYIIPILSIVFSVVVGLYAARLGARVSRDLQLQDQIHNEIIQRKKLLGLMKAELESTITHIEQSQTYWSRTFVCGNLLVNSPAFNMQDHEKLLQRTLNVLRKYEMLEIAISAAQQNYFNILSIAQKSIGVNGIVDLIQRSLGQKTFSQQANESAEESVKKIISDSALYMLPDLQELYE